MSRSYSIGAFNRRRPVMKKLPSLARLGLLKRSTLTQKLPYPEVTRTSVGRNVSRLRLPKEDAPTKTFVDSNAAILDLLKRSIPKEIPVVMPSLINQKSQPKEKENESINKTKFASHSQILSKGMMLVFPQNCIKLKLAFGTNVSVSRNCIFIETD